MTAAHLLQDLERAGVRLRLDGDTLRVRARRGALTPVLRTRLRERKGELLALLRQRAGGCPECGRPLEKGTTCWPCGYRRCRDCGAETGSPLRSYCLICAMKEEP